uniref:Magnesium transporter n=1 Tax=Aegilops tauschii subsp. strangulata TaxID=200361 RepID=A0A453DMG3_AEGTS
LNSFAVVVGEVANFVAYAFAPAILVTPLGALSIIIRQGFWCCTCTCNAAREAAHIRHSRMRPMCRGIHHH